MPIPEQLDPNPPKQILSREEYQTELARRQREIDAPALALMKKEQNILKAQSVVVTAMSVIVVCLIVDGPPNHREWMLLSALTAVNSFWTGMLVAAWREWFWNWKLIRERNQGY